MRLAPRRMSLEDAIRVLIPSTIVLVALGSNWSPSVRSVAQPLWRLALAALCLAALIFAWRSGLERMWERLRRPHYAAAGALLAVALASVAWSVDPKLTAERAVSFGLVVGAAALLALVAEERVDRARGFLAALVVGTCVTALIGGIVLLVAPHDALQAATTTIPKRYRGIGQNPNTTAMLYAATIPLATWLALETRDLRRRWAAWAAVALLSASIVGSGSRGALATAVLGALIVLLVAARSRGERIRGVVIVAAAAAIAVALASLPSPDPTATAVAPTGCVSCGDSPYNVDYYFRLEDEIGKPAAGQTGQRRTLFSSTGRTQAWRGAIGQGRDRPVAGYGFGTEDRVFVDRYYSFFGGSAENSYVGAFLQLGLVGLAGFLAVFVLLGRGLLGGLRHATPETRAAVAACAAVFVAGLALAVVQSYVYAAGNSATLTVWLASFLGLAVAPRAGAA